MKLATLCAAIASPWIGFGGYPAEAQPLEMRACQQAELGRADCGVFMVPEGGRTARTIALDLVILRAVGTQPAPDPIVILQGGPGQAATQQADFYARTFAPLREKRDIYLLDARGTGRSNSLHCSVGSTSPADFLPLAAVQSCRKKLSAAANLSAYTTRETVNDLELLRRRLKLPAVNLYGTSYGTRLALEYMRLHPGAVRTATLSGVVPAQNDAPTEYGLFAQAAFDRYVSLCSTIAKCAAAYPDPRGLLAKAQIAIASAYKTGATSVSPGLFGELVRMGLYSPDRVASLLKGLQEASAGNLSHWEKAAQGLSNFWSPNALSLGTFLSVTCADFRCDVPHRASSCLLFRPVTSGKRAGTQASGAVHVHPRCGRAGHFQKRGTSSFKIVAMGWAKRVLVPLL